MKKVTLKNNKKFERSELKKPESIDDILELRALKESLTDVGITGYKEVTNLNDISFGHFILLEKILALEIDDIDTKVGMCAQYILRPLDEGLLDNTDAEKERIHKERIESEGIGSIYGAFNRFLEVRHEYLFKTFNGVIYGTLSDDDDDDEEDEEEGTQIDSGQSAREFHTKKFFWNTMIDTVAGGDIFKYDDAVNLPMSTVMPFLAQKKSLQIVENLEYKANRR